MEKTLKWIAGLLADLLIVAGVAFLLTQYVVTVGTVEGKSMEPTLVQNQKVVVDKVSYFVSKPKRFDIVVVKFPNEENYWVKRVIGLPGELVEYRNNGKLYVNNVEIEEKFLDETITTNFFTTRKFFPSTDGVIPEGQYLVLGDNRNNSTDSRILGPLDKKDILGVARLSIYPFDHFGLLTKVMYSPEYIQIEQSI